MVKAEQVVASGLSEKSRIYMVKKKEEELQASLDEVRVEIRLISSSAHDDAEKTRAESRTRAVEAERKALESKAEEADGQVESINSSREFLVETVRKAAGANRAAALDAAFAYLLNE